MYFLLANTHSSPGHLNNRNIGECNSRRKWFWGKWINRLCTCPFTKVSTTCIKFGFRQRTFFSCNKKWQTSRISSMETSVILLRQFLLCGFVLTLSAFQRCFPSECQWCLLLVAVSSFTTSYVCLLSNILLTIFVRIWHSSYNFLNQK